jgi:asparagine synthase (glutamine-hydrolysing)
MTCRELQAEVYEFDPVDNPTVSQPSGVVWCGRGSLFEVEVDVAWRRRELLADVARVSGPWAVVIRDPVRAEYLITADPIGVMPVYWAQTSSGRFVVASWLDRLLELPDVDDSLDYEGVLIASTRGVHGEKIQHRTRFAAVSRVPGGHALHVRRDGSTQLERYWDPRSLPGPDRSLTLVDSTELLRERIDAAVRRLLPPDGQVGGHVSGGLDCTSIAALANRISTEDGRSQIIGYSWAPDDSTLPRFAGDERALLDDVAALGSMPIRTLDQNDDSGNWFLDLDRDRYPDTTHAFERFVLPRARADGVSVMLTGWGGDEGASFNGSNVLGHLARRGNLRAVWDQTSKRADLRAIGRAPFARKAKSFAATLFEAMPQRVQDVRRPADARRRNAIEAEIDAALREFSPLVADVRRERIRGFNEATDHHDYQLALLTGGHVQRRCDGWYQTGRLFDIHYRYPLLDLGVVTAALQLPWWAFRSHGWSRTAFRMAVEPWVPPSVAWNVSKSEPALFGQRDQSVPANSPFGARAHRVDDPEYQHVLALARRVNSIRQGSVVPLTPVRARPDIAPPRR